MIFHLKKYKHYFTDFKFVNDLSFWIVHMSNIKSEK